MLVSKRCTCHSNGRRVTTALQDQSRWESILLVIKPSPQFGVVTYHSSNHHPDEQDDLPSSTTCCALLSQWHCYAVKGNSVIVVLATVKSLTCMTSTVMFSRDLHPMSVYICNAHSTPNMVTLGRYNATRYVFAAEVIIRVPRNRSQGQHKCEVHTSICSTICMRTCIRVWC